MIWFDFHFRRITLAALLKTDYWEARLETRKVRLYCSNPGERSEWLTAGGSSGGIEWRSDSGYIFTGRQIGCGVWEKERTTDQLQVLEIWAIGGVVLTSSDRWSRLGEREEQEFSLERVRLTCPVGSQLEISNRLLNIWVWSSGASRHWKYKFENHWHADDI